MGKALLDVLNGKPKPWRIPFWFLRQAGRYLQTYRDLREKKDFLELCRDPELAKTVTSLPLEEMDLDGAIVFADILLISMRLGQNLTFQPNHGPILTPTWKALVNQDQVFQEDLVYVGQALDLVKKILKPHQTLIGFCGAPATVGSYMTLGGGQGRENIQKIWENDLDYKLLFKRLGQESQKYLAMQEAYGAEALMIFDTWGGVVSSHFYDAWFLDILENMIQGLSVPLIFYPGMGEPRPSLARLPWSAIAIDDRWDFPTAVSLWRKAGYNGAFQGNLDPQLLTESQPWDQALEQSQKLLTFARKELSGQYIFNVGRGLTPQTSLARLKKILNLREE